MHLWISYKCIKIRVINIPAQSQKKDRLPRACRKSFVANHGRNESDRILAFNMWLPDYRITFTPYFEMLFSLQVIILLLAIIPFTTLTDVFVESSCLLQQIICAYLVGVCYHCFDNILCILNLHTAAQFRILQHRLANMCNTNDREKFHENLGKSLYSVYKYEKFRAHIRQHQALIEFCRKLEDVFNLLVLGQVSLFSLLICLDGYLILMVSFVCVLIS